MHFYASKSTNNVEIASYVWTFIDQTNQTLNSRTPPPYLFKDPGVYTVMLNVSDLRSNWNATSVMITVRDKTPPVAEAGQDRTVDEDAVVILDGSKSTDNVAPLNWTWNFEDDKPQTLVGENVQYERAR